jgi:hypothetical protein
MNIHSFRAEGQNKHHFHWGWRYLVMGILTSILGMLEEDCKGSESRDLVMDRIRATINEVNLNYPWEDIYPEIVTIKDTLETIQDFDKDDITSLTTLIDLFIDKGW